MSQPAEPRPIDDVRTAAELVGTPAYKTLSDIGKAYEIPVDSFPLGSVSLYTFGNTKVNLKGEFGESVGFRGDNDKKQGVGGRAEFWLRPKNKAYGPGARIELMPARKSFTPSQGQQIPGAGAGLEIRTRSNIARLPVPGSRPIYQHMGIAEEVISFVGAFVGFDIPEGKIDSSSNEIESMTSYGRRRVGNAYDEAMNVVENIRAGWELELVMRWNSTDLQNGGDSAYADLSLEYSPAVKFTGYVRNFVQEHATAQRVYYRMEIVVTNREESIRYKSIKAPDLRPTNITGGPSAMNITNQIAKNSGSATAPSEPTGAPLSKAQQAVLNKVNTSPDNLAVDYDETRGPGGAKLGRPFRQTDPTPPSKPQSGANQKPANQGPPLPTSKHGNYLPEVNSQTGKITIQMKGGSIPLDYDGNKSVATKAIYSPPTEKIQYYRGNLLVKTDSMSRGVFNETYPDAAKVYEAARLKAGK